MGWRHPVAIAAGVSASACVYTAPVDELGAQDLPFLAADRDQPRLALAEHLLTDYFASDIASQPTVCIAVSDASAPVALSPEQETQLVARFPNLAPFARCAVADAGWRDTASGEPALVFVIHSFACSSQSDCSGWASYTAGATAAPSALYRMTFANGSWAFERDRRLIAQ